MGNSFTEIIKHFEAAYYRKIPYEYRGPTSVAFGNPFIDC